LLCGCSTTAIGNALLRESQSYHWPQHLLRGDNWRRTIGSDNDLLDPVSKAGRMVKTESLESFLDERRLPAHVRSSFQDYIAYGDSVHGGGDMSVRRHLAKSTRTAQQLTKA